MRLLRVAIAITLLASLLVGCDLSTKKGVFKEYETVKTDHIDTPLSRLGFDDPINVVKTTGRAIVTVGDEDVAADCTLKHLKAGDPVTVRKSDDGTWSVVEKR